MVNLTPTIYKQLVAEIIRWNEMLINVAWPQKPVLKKITES